MKKKQEEFLNGKVVLITGAASGIGGLAAELFSKCGARVAALDVDGKGLKEKSAGNENIRDWTIDITDLPALEKIIEEVGAELGPIDRVYNAAAIMPLGRILDQDTAVIHKLMAINYGGLVNITKLTLPGMLERGQGDFISFASMAGLLPTLMTGGYNASKFAVVAFTEVLYHENRNRGVRFVCVCPPLVETPLLQQGRDTVWPKIMANESPIEPNTVIDAVEDALDAGRFWVFPGRIVIIKK